MDITQHCLRTCGRESWANKDDAVCRLCSLVVKIRVRDLELILYKTTCMLNAVAHLMSRKAQYAVTYFVTMPSELRRDCVLVPLNDLIVIV